MKKSIALILILVFCIFGYSQTVCPTPKFGEVVSLEELQFSAVHEQQADESCGLSVVSSVLDIYLNIPATEGQILSMIQTKLQEEKKVSMAQMIGIFEHYEIFSQAFKMDLDNLSKAVNLYAPIIVHYDTPEPHFALVLFMDDETVVSADPALGIVISSIEQFQKRWSGYSLLINSEDGQLNKAKLENTVSMTLNKQKLLRRIAKKRW